MAALLTGRPGAPLMGFAAVALAAILVTKSAVKMTLAVIALTLLGELLLSISMR